MDRAKDRVSNEHFHLPYGHLLDVFVLGKGVLYLGLAAFDSFLVIRVEQASLPDSHTAAHLTHPGARVQEVLGRFLVFGAQHKGRVGRAGYVISEPAADLKQLWCALQCEQKGDIGAACCLQNVRKVLVGEGRELVHDDADKRLLFALFGA